MIQGRITAKSQTTVPLAVRRALGVGPGDAVNWEIDDGKAVFTRAKQADPFEHALAPFTEWADDFDTQDFSNF